MCQMVDLWGEQPDLLAPEEAHRQAMEVLGLPEDPRLYCRAWAEGYVGGEPVNAIFVTVLSRGRTFEGGAVGDRHGPGPAPAYFTTPAAAWDEFLGALARYRQDATEGRPGFKVLWRRQPTLEAVKTADVHNVAIIGQPVGASVAYTYRARLAIVPQEWEASDAEEGA